MKPALRQRGVTMMILVVILVLGSSILLVRSINAAALRADRYRVSQDSLIRAKEALIARAVTDDNRPGSLPCPDTDDDGDAELFAGIECPSYIGRLPWRTLGLPDLRDASGERIWYALSRTYRDHTNAQPINSNTPGLLTVNGGATSYAALLLAPGTVLMRAGAPSVQARGCTVGVDCDAALRCTLGAATPKCNPANYLETLGGVDNADGDTAYVSAVESASFNDRHLEISVDDIMSLVERRAGRELGGKLRAHFDAWQGAGATVNNTKGFYPWAAPFNDPSVASPGTNDTQTGQLPMSAANVAWSNASITLGNCVGVGTSQINCTALAVCIVVCLTPVNARLSGVGTAFIDPPDGSEMTTNFIGLSVLGVTPPGTWTLNPAQQALDFSWNGVALIGVGVVQVIVNAPAQSAWTTDPAEWLVANEWTELAHYSVAPRYGINGTNACGGAGTCVSVAGATDKQAVVTMTGRALAGQNRAMPALGAFLEGGNQDPTDLALERNLRTPAFNDQPIAVRP